jgi:hypothetical protein
MCCGGRPKKGREFWQALFCMPQLKGFLVRGLVLSRSSRRTHATPVVALGLANPAAQRLGLAADFRSDRADRRALRGLPTRCSNTIRTGRAARSVSLSSISSSWCHPLKRWSHRRGRSCSRRFSALRSGNDRRTKSAATGETWRSPTKVGRRAVSSGLHFGIKALCIIGSAVGAARRIGHAVIPTIR